MSDYFFKRMGSLISSTISNLKNEFNIKIDTKVDNTRVLTDVPANALFTDTVYTHPPTHSISEISGLQEELNKKLQSNQTITFYGDLNGTGFDSVQTSLSTTGVIPGTYSSVTVDSKGRITQGLNHNTLDGYGIIDAANKNGSPEQNFSVKTLTSNGNLLPSENSLFNIGSESTRWKSLYADTAMLSSAGLYIDNSNVISSNLNTIKITSVDKNINIESIGTESSVVIDANKSIDLKSQNVFTHGNHSINGNLTVSGNITVSGNNTIVNVNTVTTKDNIIVLNSGELGYGVTSRLSGIQIDRGYLDDYHLVFDEMDDILKIGHIDKLQNVATQDWTNNNFSKSDHNHLTNVDGDVFGTGSLSSLNLVLKKSGVVAGTYNSVTVNEKGLVTDGKKFTTLAEYNITDAQPKNNNLTSISTINSGTGFLKRVGDAWEIDTTQYLKENNQINILSDNISGNGTFSSINLTLKKSGVTSGKYNSVYVDEFGRVTQGYNLSTLNDYGITDAVAITHVGSKGASVHGLATSNEAGFMSADDKSKLDSIGFSANNYILPLASTTVIGGVKIASIKTQTALVSPVTNIENRTYATQLNSSNHLVINVPWTDTTYNVVTSTTDGLMSSSDKIKLDSISNSQNNNGGNYIHPSSTVIPATYSKVTVDAFGHITSGSILSSDDIPELNASKIKSGVFDIALFPNFQGDISSNQGSNILTLNDSGVLPGTYNTVQVDSKGRVVFGKNVNVDNSNHSHNINDLSDVSTISNVKNDILQWDGVNWVNKNINDAGIQVAGNYLTQNQHITLSGDVSGSGTNSITVKVNDDSHQHSISTIYGLKNLLDSKISNTGGNVVGSLTTDAINLLDSNIDLSLGDFFYKNITKNTTFTVSNTPESGIFKSFLIELTNGGEFLINWWGVKWNSGNPPILSDNNRDILGFYTRDGGLTWNGYVVSQDNN